MGEFTWPVSRSGYRWDKVNLHTTVSYGLVTPDTGEGFSRYNPMIDFPDLFMEFAALGDTEHDMLRFAARYGQLTQYVTVFHAEHFGDRWGRLCSDVVKSPDEQPDFNHRTSGLGSSPTELSSVLAAPNGVNDAPKFATKVVSSLEVEERSQWYRHMSEMRLAVSEWRDNNRSTDPTRLPELRRKIEAILTGRLEFTFDAETGWPSHAPTDLLSALWLQFAKALSGNRSYRTCKQCGKLFPVSSVAVNARFEKRRSRQDKVYCSPTCQQAAAYVLKKEKRQQRGPTSQPDQPPAPLRRSTR